MLALCSVMPLRDNQKSVRIQFLKIWHPFRWFSDRNCMQFTVQINGAKNYLTCIHYIVLTSKVDVGITGSRLRWSTLSPNLRPHNPATGFRPPSATVVSAELFLHGTWYAYEKKTVPPRDCDQIVKWRRNRRSMKWRHEQSHACASISLCPACAN